MTVKNFFNALLERFNRDQTTTLAASLAYYTALSLAPLLILFVTIAAKVSDRLQTTFVSQVSALVGGDAAKAIEAIMDSAKSRPDLSTIAGFFGILTLAVSASLIFGELRSDLNRIFEIDIPTYPEDSFLMSIWRFVRARMLHVGLALSFIFTLIVSLIVSSVLSSAFVTEAPLIANVANIGISAFFYIGLFALMFRYLPDKRLSWRRAVKGAFLTSVLFVIGKEVIGLYLGNSALGSSYGAAGSIIVLLVWVYYSALITFVGAQVSSLLDEEGRNFA